MSDHSENPPNQDLFENTPQRDGVRADSSSAYAPDMMAARRAALKIMDQILNRKQALDLTLEKEEAFTSLPMKDKAFVRMMVSTALRRLGQIDHMIMKASDKSEPPHPPTLHNIIRLAVTQIAFMAVPDYAVVDTAVRMTEEGGMRRQKGFVNALLRNIAANAQDWLTKQDEANLNIPNWLMSLWIKDYDLRAAANIAVACLTEAPLDISIKDENDANHWQAVLNAQPALAGSLRLNNAGSVYELPGYNDGMWWVQDAAAALPVKLLGPDLAGQTVLDLCAAPGGKTMQLAAKGAIVTAVDRSVNRLKRLENNLERMRLNENVTVEVADASVWKPREVVQNILLDAPCSATGTIRRHPDLLHLKQPQDLDRLIAIQSRLLENSYDMLASGGTLIYCTCSLQKSEGEQQVAEFLDKYSDMERVPVEPHEVSNLTDIIDKNGDVRILPYHHATAGGLDGFFISRLWKK